MSDITVIAHIRARPGKEAQVREALQNLVEPTRTEAGCSRYDLHCDLKDPAHFMFVERWESTEAHDRHMDSEHIAEFVMASRGAIGESTIQFFEAIA